jgi:hypothetical protein
MERRFGSSTIRTAGRPTTPTFVLATTPVEAPEEILHDELRAAVERHLANPIQNETPSKATSRESFSQTRS